MTGGWLTGPTRGRWAGAAALLAGRLDESGGLEDPAVTADPTGADEVAVWRAWRQVQLGDAASLPAASRSFAQHLPLMLGYPEPLRRRLLPAAIETVAAHDPKAAARMLDAAGELPGLDYARALLEAQAGKTDAALARLDALAAGSDRRERGARCGARGGVATGGGQAHAGTGRRLHGGAGGGVAR